jgi:hypothetical protein
LSQNSGQFLSRQIALIPQIRQDRRFGGTCGFADELDCDVPIPHFRRQGHNFSKPFQNFFRFRAGEEFVKLPETLPEPADGHAQMVNSLLIWVFGCMSDLESQLPEQPHRLRAGELIDLFGDRSPPVRNHRRVFVITN